MDKLKKLLLSFLVILMVAGSVPAQKNAKDAKPQKRIKVGLVLCGGGAKGAAHIGAIKKLEEVGIQPDVIVGTSMGALIGGLYAMGYTSSQMDTIISNADWDYLLSDNIKREDMNFSVKQEDDKYFISIPFSSLAIENLTSKKKEEKKGFSLPGGFVKGNNVLNLLNGLAVGYQDSIDFRTLPIPFACIATDLATGDEVVLDHGYLPLSMRASMAIPGFFAPVTIDGKVLVDGGVVNNFPVDVAKQMGANIVIGVDVQSDLASAEDLKSIDAVLMQLIGLMGNDRFMENQKNTDIYIRPDVSKYGTLSFTKEAVDSLMYNGYKAADERDEMLRALAKLIGENRDEKLVNRAVEIDKTRLKIGTITLDGVDDWDRKWLLKLAGLQEHTVVSGVQINNALSLFTGTQAFSQITYTLTKNQDTEAGSGVPEYNLRFKFLKGASNIVSIGARYDTEEAAAMLVRLGINQSALHGSKGDLTARLSLNPYLKLGYDYVFRTFPRLEVEYTIAKKDVNIYSDKTARNNIAFVYQGLEAAFANIKYFRNFNTRIGTRMENFKFSKFMTERDVEERIRAKTYFSIFGRAIMDTRDSRYFPESGHYLQIDASAYLLGIHHDFKPFTSFRLDFSTIIPLRNGFAVQPHVYGRINIRNRMEIPFYNFIGGSEPSRYFEHQIPFIGINYANAFDNSVSVFRVDVRKKVGKKHYFYAIVNYLRTDKSADKMLSFDRKGYWGIGSQYSMQTKLGPLSFNLHWSDINKKKIGAYLSFGYFF